ncbi:MAG: hypothetical protein RRB13_01765 [bacterium]|nr:hypothetical protein [bacterium]
MSARELQKSVDQFIRSQRRKRIQPAERDLPLTRLIEETGPLDPDWVEQISQSKGVAPNQFQPGKQAFVEAIKRLNGLNAAKRLFVLETINLLGSPDAIDNLVTSLFNGKAEERRRLAMSFILSFRGTDRVTDLLVKAKHLFNAKTIDSQTHGLVSFRFEMAEKLILFFRKSYVLARAKELGMDPELSLDLLRGILKDGDLVNLSKFLIIDEELKERLPEVISAIQSHRMLPIYAKKRYDFLRDFFVHLSEPGKFLGVDGSDVSRICAAFLWTNRQLIPPQNLVAAMLKTAEYSLPATRTQLMNFLEQLAPSTVDALIKDLKDIFKALMKEPYADLGALFASAKSKYDQGEEDLSLFGQVYAGLMDMKAKGWLAIKGVEEFFEKVRHDLGAGANPQQSLDDIFNAAPDVDNVEPPMMIEKHSEFNRLFRKLRPVNTTVDGFRGPREGAGKRAAQANLRVFESQENMTQFKEGMEVMLEYFSKNCSAIHAYEFKPPKFPRQVMEQLGSFLAMDEDEEPLLLCFGITYFEADGAGGSGEIEDLITRHMLPYFFTMVSSNFNTVLHARSRKIDTDFSNEDEEDGAYEANLGMLEFKAADLTYAEYFRSAAQHLLALFHGLPEPAWRSAEVQGSVAFLFDKLKIAY